MSEAAACVHLDAFSFIYPAEACTVAQAIKGARCWQLDTVHGRIVYAVRLYGPVLWVAAAAGRTSAPAVDALAQALLRRAAEAGAGEIGFQTARRGLVRVAKRYGYRVIRALPQGWELRKS